MYSARPASLSQACSGPIDGIVEAGGNGVGERDLAGFVLQDVGVRALQHAREPPWKRAACSPRLLLRPPASTPTSSLSCLPGIRRRCRSRWSRRRRRRRSRSAVFFCFEDLRAGFAADDSVEVADHRRIGMRSQHAAEQIMRGAGRW